MDKKPITPETLTDEMKARQLREDEQMIFVLAALMVDVYVATVTSDAHNINDVREKLQLLIHQTGELLKSSPGFIERFKAAQQQMLKAAGMQLTTPPRSKIVVPS